MRLMDWLRGRRVEPTPPLPETGAGMMHQTLSEGAQGPGLALPMGKDPQTLKRVRTPEGDRDGPAERLMPHEVERLRDAAIRQPEPKQEAAQEAARMGLTRTAQPAPSPGGSGIGYVNTRVRQPVQAEPKPSNWDDLMKSAEQAVEQTKLTKEQQPEIDRSPGRER